MKRLCLFLIVFELIFSGCACLPNTTSSDSPQKITALYLSEKGETLTALFDTADRSVEVTLPDGEKIRLPVAVSGSGARYSNGHEVFWEHQGVGSYWVGGRLVFRGR
jgi:membrane-bound inhibitor of C-type lysozyme